MTQKTKCYLVIIIYTVVFIGLCTTDIKPFLSKFKIEKNYKPVQIKWDNGSKE